MALVQSPPPAVAAPRIAGSLRLAARQFPRQRAAMLGLICLALICLAAVLAPWIAPYDPIQIKLSAKLKPPSFEHWLGTDHFGRDVFSRLLYGGRTSPSLRLPAGRLPLLLGGPPRLASRQLPQHVRNLPTPVVDVSLSRPP